MLKYMEILFLREAAIGLVAAVKRFTTLTPQNSSFGKGTITDLARFLLIFILDLNKD